MNEIDFIYPLSSDLEDRLRVRAIKIRGRIVSFVVQYEALISGEWRAVVRYDTAHGFTHKDIIRANGEVIKQPLFFETYNLAFTFATLDLKVNWRQYRDNIEKEIRK